MSVSARLAIAGSAMIAAIGAYRFGGGADARISPPTVASASVNAATSAPANAPEADVVAMHLVDLVDGARITMPNLERGTWAMTMAWRKMPLAFHDLSASSKKITTSIALRTSETEVQWSVPMGSGERWTPDARVWNMSEGSFDEREAIFAPTPATIAFKITVPPKAKFIFSPATANANGDATIFSVSITDARGQKTTPYEKRFLPEQTSGWVDDESVDLAAFAGQSIELALETRADPRKDGETPKARWHAPRNVDPSSNDTGISPPSEAKGQSGLSLALWGNPEIRATEPTKDAYNVLFIVVDALRPDVIAAFHDDQEDQKKLSAPLPPLDALLPKIPGLTPNIDALASRGVRFTHAYSAGSWTRPGTLAMLSGMRSTELGLDPLPWVLPEPMASAYYRSEPPMLPLLLRRDGTATRAFVNNYFMVGYAPVGVDMGFERIDDHRYRTKDTGEITKDAVAWLKRNKDQRFFAFCNYNSPHEPLEPPQRFLDKLADYKEPRDPLVRMYMAEAGKDDEAIGVLMHTLDELDLRKKTLVIVTADHGETLSADHGGTSKLDHMPIRYHHAVTNFEETTRIPILMSLPGVLPENAAVTARVRNIDIAPTILEIVGHEKPAKVSGLSMMGLVRGQKESDERTVLTEGRATRGLIYGHWRAIFREGNSQTTCYPMAPHNADGSEKCITVAEELFDLDADPGERHNLAKARPDMMDEMRARFAAAKKNVPVAGSAAATATTTTAAPVQNTSMSTQKTAENVGPPRLRFRFAGAGGAHRVSGKISFAPGTTLAWEPAAIARSAVVVNGSELDLALTTSADDAIGLDVTPTPPSADVHWNLFLDDGPWPASSVFAGPYGLFDSRVASGLASEEAREAAFSHTVPTIDASRDLGLFVVREQATAHDASDVAASRSSAGAGQEMDRLLKEWGYSHGSAKKPQNQN